MIKYISILLLLLANTSVSYGASRLFGPAPTSSRSAFIVENVGVSPVSGAATVESYAQIAPVTMGRTGFGHQALISKVLTNVPKIDAMPKPQPEILSASLNSQVVRTNVYSGWYGFNQSYTYNSMSGVVTGGNGGFWGIYNNYYQPYAYTYDYSINGYTVRYNSSVCALSNQGTVAFQRLCNVVRAPEPSPALWKNSAIVYFRNNASSIATQLAKFLKDNGVSSGYFKYTQKVNTYQNGNIVEMDLKWDAQFDSSRGIIFGNPKLISSADPIVLYVEYIPLNMEPGIDPALNTDTYKGYLKYVVKDTSNPPVAISEMAYVNTNGAYDEPATNEDGEDTQCGSEEGVADGCIDQNAGLRCLLDKASASGCPAGVPDVNELLDATGANFAIVDYARRIKPKFVAVNNESQDLSDTSNEEDNPNADAPEEIAAMTVNVLSRTLSKNNECNLEYKNTGTYSTILERIVERWTVDLDGAYSQIGEMVSQYSTPVIPYSQTLVMKNTTAASLDKQLLSPMLPNCAAYPQYCLIPDTAIYKLESKAPIIDNSDEIVTIMTYKAPASNGVEGLGVDVTCAGTSNEEGVIQEFYGYSGASKNQGSGRATFSNGQILPSPFLTVLPGITEVSSEQLSLANGGVRASTFMTNNLVAQEIYAKAISTVNVCPAGQMGTCDTQTGFCQATYGAVTANSVSSCLVQSTSQGGVETCDTPPDCYFDDNGAQICPPPNCQIEDPTYTCPDGFVLADSVSGKICSKPQNKVFYLEW